MASVILKLRKRCPREAIVAIVRDALKQQILLYYKVSYISLNTRNTVLDLPFWKSWIHSVHFILRPCTSISYNVKRWAGWSVIK